MTAYLQSRLATGVALALVGLLGVFLGVAYLPRNAPSSLPEGLRLISDQIPLWIWAYLWVAAGATALVAAFWQKPAGMAVVIGMLLVWAFSYSLSYAKYLNGQSDADRAWVAALLYAVLAGLLFCTAKLAQLALRATRRIEPQRSP